MKVRNAMCLLALVAVLLLPALAVSEGKVEEKPVEVLYFSADSTKIFYFKAELSGEIRLCLSKCSATGKKEGWVLSALKDETDRIRLMTNGVVFSYRNPEAGEDALEFWCVNVKRR